MFFFTPFRFRETNFFMARTSAELKAVIATIACFGLLSWRTYASKETVVAATKYGAIKGLTVHFPHSPGPITAINKFLGVPYASAPVGKLRFKKPRALQPWSPAVYDATYFHNVCMQKTDLFLNAIRNIWPDFSIKDFSEDCLFLNIYTPKLLPSVNGTIERQNAGPYPVMVYFHGGSYFAGTPLRLDTTGEILPLRGVVLVAVQYRLGAFGFLTTGDGNAPGNAGILDQVQALKWIKENIRSFDGDPKEITIFGESAGGAGVGLHTVSPLTRGLFHRAIADSGVDFSPFAYLPLASEIKFSKKLAKKLGCSLRSSKVMIECLRNMDAFKIAASLSRSSFNDFRPVVDGYYLPKAPQILRRQGKFHNVPLLTGFTKDDGGFLLHNSTNLIPLALRREYFKNEVVRKKLELHKDKQTTQYLVAAIEHQYTPWPHTRDINKLRKKVIEMYTDYYLSAPTHAVVEQHAVKAPVFLYEFRYRSNHDKTDSWRGAWHGSNSKYIFGAPFLKLTNATDMQEFDERDRSLSNFVMTLYTNFAKFGDPTPESVNGVKWKPFDRRDYAYLKIDEKPKIAFKFHPHRIAFWNHFYPYFVNITSNCNDQDEPAIGAVNNVASHPQNCLYLVYSFIISICMWKQLL